MKPKVAGQAKHAAEIRKPGPVRRLTREEIRQLEHAMNLTRYLKKHSDR